jgi:hypothetical protein
MIINSITAKGIKSCLKMKAKIVSARSSAYKEDHVTR